MNRLARLLLAPPDPLRPFSRHLAQADAANAGRDWPAAERFYGYALGIDPLRDDLWVQYGHALKEQGRWADAERAYATAAQIAPQSADAQVQLGHARKALGRGREAAQAFRAALAVAGDRDDLRAELAALGEDPGTVAPDAVPFQDVDERPVRSAAAIPRPALAPPSALERLCALPARLVPGRPREPILFIHMHKTGGLTLDDVIAAEMAPARICPVKDDHLHLYGADALARFDLFSAHVDVGALRLLPRPARTVSVFREPRARLISFYRFHAGHDLSGRHSVNAFAQMANAMSAETFFEDDRVRRAPEVFNHYLAVFALTYAQLRAAPAVSPDRVTEAHLAKAIARVRSLDAVVLLERFDEGVALACSALGLPPRKAVAPRNQTDVLARRMTGRVPAPVTMTPRLAAALADLVRFDEPIYAAARAEFERRWQVFAPQGS